jgi:hypothetical protein
MENGGSTSRRRSTMTSSQILLRLPRFAEIADKPWSGHESWRTHQEKGERDGSMTLEGLG